MPFDGWNTIEGRHLVFIYGSILLVQGGYFAWVAVNWLRLRKTQQLEAAEALYTPKRPLP